MSYRFEMSNVKDSLTHLFRYVSDITDENAWKSDPVILDSPTGTSIRFSHPSSASKDVEAKSEPFSSFSILMAKPYSPQLSFDFSFDNKKAALRFSDILQEWNKSIRDEYFSKIKELDGFSFKLQVRTTFKKSSLEKKIEDIYVVSASSVGYEDIAENFKKVAELCNNTEMMEDEKAVKSRVPGIVICRNFSIDDLASECSTLDAVIKTFHKLFMLESKILSEKDAKKAVKVQSKVGEKEKFCTILSNRADEKFYCRLTKTEFQNQRETYGVQVWKLENLEMKKYIRAALKLESEI